MNNDILSLQETSANSWQAKYSGNYGTYTIRIKIDGRKMIDFSCSCPSEYYPCKHIAIIKEAIYKRIAESKKVPKEEAITVEEVLKNVPHQELIAFIARQAKYNPELTNTILLEFIQKSTRKTENTYSLILRKALKEVDFDEDDLYDYHEDSISIDILDEWLAKAEDYIAQNRFDEAIAICKACIEEYAEWIEESATDVAEYVDPVYQDKPFDLLTGIASRPAVDSLKLFSYCSIEMDKPKYTTADMSDGFNNLLLELADNNNADEFIALQDALLKKITDRSSFEAQRIINRKIAFYNKINQPITAWQLVTDNIQIEGFCKQVVEKKITDKNFAEAKKLISDFLSTRQNSGFYNHGIWNDLILDIAQKEADIPLIRKISFTFIENNFQTKYYRIYKSSFNKNEWKNELPRIIEHYGKKGQYFSESVANIFAEEKDAANLMKYIENHLTPERIDNYHSYLAPAFPKETLELFRKAINLYAEKNTGRNIYEYIVVLFNKMAKIEGGKEMVRTMVAQYKTQYKNRRAMIEILNKVKL